MHDARFRLDSGLLRILAAFLFESDHNLGST